MVAKTIGVGILLVFGLLNMAVAEDTIDATKDVKEAQGTIAVFKKTDPGLTRFFDHAVGYAVFRQLVKGAVGIGGASGSGIVFEKGKAVGKARLTQGTIGAQIGGQTYSEVIFFETVPALTDFKKGTLALAAQVSAVAASAGASRTPNTRKAWRSSPTRRGALWPRRVLVAKSSALSPSEGSRQLHRRSPAERVRILCDSDEKKPGPAVLASSRLSSFVRRQMTVMTRDSRRFPHEQRASCECRAPMRHHTLSGAAGGAARDTDERVGQRLGQGRDRVLARHDVGHHPVLGGGGGGDRPDRGHRHAAEPRAALGLGEQLGKFRAVEELVNVTASMVPAASASRKPSRAGFRSPRAVGRHLRHLGADAPELVTRTSRVWAARGEQNPIAGVDETAQTLDQPLGAILAGDEVGPHAVLGQRIGGRRADRGHAPAGHRGPAEITGGQPSIHHHDAVDRREDDPGEGVERRQRTVQRLPRRRRPDDDHRRFDDSRAAPTRAAG